VQYDYEVYIIAIITRKCRNCDALPLEDARRKRQSFWASITRIVMPQPTNSTLPQPLSDSATPISSQTIDGHLLVFCWPYFHCACTRTAISELPVIIEHSHLNMHQHIAFNKISIFLGRSTASFGEGHPHSTPVLGPASLELLNFGTHNNLPPISLCQSPPMATGEAATVIQG